MDSTPIFATLSYLLIFRLAIIALGGISIYLGYRLFVEGFSKVDGSGGAELGTKFGNAELTLKNAAPGTFFAAFGALITIVVLTSSPPEFKREEKRDTTTGEVTESKLTMRGDETEQVVDADTEAARLHREFWDQHYADALALIEKVNELVPEDPDYRDTLAGLYFTDGKFDQALQQQEKAVKLLEGLAQTQSDKTAAKLDSFRIKREFFRRLLD